MRYRLYKPDRTLKGKIFLERSKSISNRILIIRALCEENFSIQHLSGSKDTQTLVTLLQQFANRQWDEPFDAGAAGTTFRFMTAYLARQAGTQVLTGTERMKQRPIGVLVDALRKLGARIEYLEEEGFPPLQIGPPDSFKQGDTLHIPASTSSQYITALLLIAPALPHGLELQLEGKVVSRPYIEMTLRLMEHFGVAAEWKDDRIRIPAAAYQASPFEVEADWSAASYYYAMGVLADPLDLELVGLHSPSLQGDAILTEMMRAFGIHTRFTKDGLHLSKISQPADGPFRWDFIRCPDLAQTLAVVCAAIGRSGEFSGLETLRIKETDRVSALRNELAKVAVVVEGDEICKISGRARLAEQPTFETYEDHRMAMAFAPLSMLGPIEVKEPMVVVKSYPGFWDDLETLGFEIIQKA